MAPQYLVQLALACLLLLSPLSSVILGQVPAPLPPYNNSEECQSFATGVWSNTVTYQFPVSSFTAPGVFRVGCYSFFQGPTVPNPLPTTFTTVVTQSVTVVVGTAMIPNVTINTQTDTTPLFSKRIGNQETQECSGEVDCTYTYSMANLVCDFPQVLDFYYLVSVQSAGDATQIESAIATKILRINSQFDPTAVGNELTIMGSQSDKTAQMYFSMVNTQTNKYYTINLVIQHDSGPCNNTDTICYDMTASTNCGNFAIDQLPVLDTLVTHNNQTATYTLTIMGVSNHTVYVRVSGILNMWQVSLRTTAISDPTPSPSPQPPPPSSDPCFPGEAKVILRSGQVKLMQDLQIGDQIMTGLSEYSTVFFFSHRIHGAKFGFIRIETTDPRNTITVSLNHYLRIQKHLVEAKQIKIGDHIQNVNGALLQVINISKVSAAGLFAPHTMNDKLIVDGIQASVYTTSVHPVVARVLLAPLKMFYKIFGFSGIQGFLDNGNDLIRSWMPRGPSVF